MRVIYVPIGEKVWLSNLIQRGNGLGSYSGERFQRGYGLGSMFGSLLRSVLPIAKTVAKKVGKQALRTGAEVAQDYLQGADIGQSIKTRGKQGVNRLLNKGIRAVKKNQRGKGLGTRTRGPAKGIKGLKKPRKKPAKRKAKRKPRTDALGLY